jgi:hypothetical protein
MALFTVGIDTEEEVKAIKANAMATLLDLSNGSSVISWSSENTSVSKLVPSVDNMKYIIKECNIFLMKLKGKRYVSTRAYFID